MVTLQEFRQQNPDYNDMSDQELAGALHDKFYQDMPKEEFMAQLMPKDDGDQYAPMTNTGAALKGLKGYALNSAQSIPLVGTYTDEAIGAINALFGGDYDKSIQSQQQARDYADMVAPGAQTLGKVATIVGTLPAAVAGGIAATGVPSAYRAINVAKGLGLGLSTGALQGFGEQETDGNSEKSYGQSLNSRLGNALMTGVIGGALGGIGGAFMTPLTRKAAAELSAKKQIEDVLSAEASNMQKAAEATSGSFDDIAQKAQEPFGLENLKGRARSLIDSGNKAALRRAEAIVSRGGEGADVIEQAVFEAKSDIPKGMIDKISDKFPSGINPYQYMDDLQQKAYNAADTNLRPIYEKYAAAANPKNPYSRNAFAGIEGKDISKEGVRGIKDAVAKLDKMGVLGKIKQYDPEFASSGYGFEEVHKLAKKLDDIIRSAPEQQMAFNVRTAGDKGDLLKLRREMRGFMKEVPEFAEFSKKYSDAITLFDATEAGKKAEIFGKFGSQVINDYKKLPADAQEAWRLGQAENIYKKLNSDSPITYLKNFTNKSNKEVLDTFFGKEKADDIVAYATDAVKRNRDYNTIVGNSRTALRTNLNKEDLADLDSRALIEKLGRMVTSPRQAVVDKFMDIAGRTGQQQLAERDFLMSNMLTQKGDELYNSVNAILGKNPNAFKPANPFNTVIGGRSASPFNPTLTNNRTGR